MSKPLKPRHPLFRCLLTGLTLLAAVSAGVWLLFPGGLLHHWLQPVPLLDPATPRIQGVYTLAEVHLESDAKSRAAAYVLIKVPAFPDCSRGENKDGMTLYSLRGGPMLRNGTATDPNSPIIQATGQTSEGDVLPLPWMIVGDAVNPKYVRVDIPSGYSNACRFVDLTLVTRTGPFPRWRIDRLPSMKQIIPASATPQTSQTIQGIRVSARAWRMRHEIYLQLLPVLPLGSHQWELGPRQSWSEWEKGDQPAAVDKDTLNYQPIEGRGSHFTEADTRWYGSLMTILPADYHSASKFVRLDCGLIQFETLDEAVTFPDVSVQHEIVAGASQNPQDDEYQTFYVFVPKAVTLTTPSGIAVTLPTQGKESQANGNGLMAGDINVRLSVKPSYRPEDLPSSPLVHQFGKPVTIRVDFAPADSLITWSTQPGDTQSYGLRRPMNPKWSEKLSGQKMQKVPLQIAPPNHENLTVIIHQRTEIQTIPLSFTVPVAGTPPPDFRR